MWPQALQMTREECRGILRRLELESYSHVISVFRAQGGLNENKAKLLEELRSVFHISQERHRAEARRVANDEQLSTIAEAISGPNTWQEWSREGRRSFPMLPRVAPQTALAIIANNVAAEAAAENSKLPYPADTVAPLAAKQAALAQESAKISETDEKAAWNIVTSDPFKVPDIPVVPKKTLKRNMPDNQSTNNKRRTLGDAYATKQQQTQQQHQHQQEYNADDGETDDTHSDESNIRKLYHKYSKIQQQHQQQQQQQLYQQQMKQQKSLAKKGVTTQTKRQAIPKGKRTQILKEQEQGKQQQQQQQQPQQSTTMSSSPQDMQQQQQVAYAQVTSTLEPQPEWPEEGKDATVAASKKDISKNLSKLHIPALNTVSATSLRSQPFECASNGSQLPAAAAPQPGPKSEKQLISTPVQKYIVEDRQSPAVVAASTTGHLSSTTSQMMTLPQLSATASKLRTMNTIFSPSTKLATTKKLPAVGLSAAAAADSVSQSQVYNIIDAATLTPTNVATAQQSAHAPAAPTHTPPAVIQLNNNNAVSGEQGLAQPSQGKVLTTKLLPIVLSGNSSGKIETINNGATIVNAGNSPGAVAANSGVFKTLSPTMLVSSAGGSSALTLSTTIGAGGHNVFRKQPNIIKTGIIGVGSTGGTPAAKASYNASGLSSSTHASGGPQIISNIKLPPANVTSTAATPTSTSQFIKNVPGSGIRASVKICQSPNGKMFIQPANADALKATKLQGGLPQKLVPSQFPSQTGVSTSSTAPQRIAIQKVQIIPAPSSPGTLQSHQPKPASSLTIGNKANMIFMPTTCGARGTSTISLPKTAGLSNIATKNLPQKLPDVPKQNVFVIGAVAQQPTGLKSNSKEGSSNQMITEDTPIDILNMPIIVDDGSTGAAKSVSSPSTALTLAAGGGNIGDTVTVLPDDLLDDTASISMNQSSSAVVLEVTDWEMELDQATAVAAATKARTQRRSASKLSKYGDHQQTIIVDDNFDDVIVEEAFTEEARDTHTHQQLHALNQVLQDDDMQIEVVDEDQRQPQQKHKIVPEIVASSKIKTSATESEIDAKPLEENIIETYDGAIVAEMDENTAIEYIEEDHNDEGFDYTPTGFKSETEMQESQADNGKPEGVASETVDMDLEATDNADATVDEKQFNLHNCGAESSEIEMGMRAVNKSSPSVDK